MDGMPRGEAAELPAGTQTLLRGLAVIDAVAKGARTLQSIGKTIGYTRSTTHRLVAALNGTGHLGIVPGLGYVLGSRLIELGYLAREQLPLTTIAQAPFGDPGRTNTKYGSSRPGGTLGGFLPR